MKEEDTKDNTFSMQDLTVRQEVKKFAAACVTKTNKFGKETHEIVDMLSNLAGERNQNRGFLTS